jgi:hypothetical protein
MNNVMFFYFDAAGEEQNFSVDGLTYPPAIGSVVKLNINSYKGQSLINFKVINCYLSIHKTVNKNDAGQDYNFVRYSNGCYWVRLEEFTN